MDFSIYTFVPRCVFTDFALTESNFFFGQDKCSDFQYLTFLCLFTMNPIFVVLQLKEADKVVSRFELAPFLKVSFLLLLHK